MRYDYTQTAAGTVMPLLMGCTKATPIEMETTHEVIIYDPITQKIEMDMRTVGTKSLKSTQTKVKINSLQWSAKSDKKNEIDDSKVVK